MSYCVLSNDRKHDVAMVYEVQKGILADLKSQFPDKSNVIYFSDGCAGQYKNRKNLYNLCHHKDDFGFKAKWIFFATSHGRQPCDGIGETVKRIVANASLKRDLKDQILSPQDMFNFCRDNILNITFKFISQDEVNDTRDFLTSRFEGILRIPETRSFHEFIPLSKSSIQVKRTSEDPEPSLVHNFKKGTQERDIIQVEILDYVTCLYDNKWWVGIKIGIDREEEDMQIKFMHPPGPSRSFQWPNIDDICWVPNEHILYKIDIPTTSSGRSYNIKQEDRKQTEKLFLLIAK